MFLVFFIFWVVLNGKINGEIAAFGVVIALAVFLFCCKFLEYSVKKDIAVCKVSGLALCYVFLLLGKLSKPMWESCGLSTMKEKKSNHV